MGSEVRAAEQFKENAASVTQKIANQSRELTAEEEAYISRKTEGSQTAWTIQSDPDLIAYAQKTMDAKLEADGGLSRHDASLAITLATNSTTSDPEVSKLQESVVEKFKDVPNNEFLRANCYSFAVGDRGTNPLLVAAVPGQAAMGMDASDGAVDSSTIIKRAVADGLEYAGQDPEKLEIPPGKRLVALYAHEGEDYHWTRFDKSADGGLIVSDKYGVVGDGSEVHVRKVDNIYDEMSNDFGNHYEFKAFFLVPEEGIDVGMDAHMRKEGQMPSLESQNREAGNKITSDQANQVDTTYLRNMTSGGPSPS